MRKTIYLSLLIFLTASCTSSPAPSQDSIQTAIAQTQASIPTATQIPLSSLDLESILITSGDLPAGYEASQIRSKLSDISKAAPKPDYFISQSISHNGNFGGGIDVLVYEDVEKTDLAYRLMKRDMPGDSVDIEIGDGGQVSSTSLIVSTVSLSFIRCHAAISIQFMGTTQKDDIVSYAQRLDERLKPIVCR